jgi:nucleoside-diphosphate-sugar epimerase
MILRDKLVLITGANGFIGARLAERLASEEGARVRGLVHAKKNSAIENVIGDVVNSDAVNRAMQGCDVVIHCAAMQGGHNRLDDFRRVNVGGTLNLMRAARQENAARFIHIGTINEHGIPPPRDANADSPLCFRGDFYSVSKAEGERAAWEFAREHRMPFAVVRPACTYGPGSNAWSVQPLRRVARNAPVLIGGGNGMCNAVYIDNLVDLIMLVLKDDAALGHAFIGAEGRGVTWREFYGAYAQMLGGKRLHGMPRWFGFAVANAFELQSKLSGYSPRLARSSIEFYSHRVVFDIEKSKRLLGYAPRISFEEGMRRTHQWLIESRNLK